jgi:hypothetical protein
MENPRWPLPKDIFNIRPHMQNILKLFYSEATYQFHIKLCWNETWMVLYKMFVFYVNSKSRISPTIGPFGK